MPAVPLFVATTSLPWGKHAVAYSQTLKASSGGKTPYTWSATAALPAGLKLTAAGVLSGKVAKAGSYPISVKVTDSTSPTKKTATAALTLNVT